MNPAAAHRARLVLLFLLCRRGSMLSTAIFVYAATSPINGYFGGSLYAKQGGNKYSMHGVSTLTHMWCATSFQMIWFFWLYTIWFVCDQTGRRWIKQMFIGAFMIPAMVCGTAFFINFIAIYYHASRAIPFGTMVSFYTAAPPCSAVRSSLSACHRCVKWYIYADDG